MATPPTSVAIRAASASDVEAIAALHLASWWAAYRGIVPDQFLHGITLESRIARWQRALSSSESTNSALWSLMVPQWTQANAKTAKP